MENVVKTDGKKYYETRVLPFINKLKNKTEKYISTSNYERAMDNISVISNILYHTNQYLFDEQIENYVSEIAKKFTFSPNKQQTKKKIFFYDGFGLDHRGLARIYIKSLVKHYEIVYCTLKQYKDRIPSLLTLLGEKNRVYFIDENGYEKKIRDISNIIKKEIPSDIFIYVNPFDIAAITAFTAYKGAGKRYFINLTDHAFWVGNNSYDRLIEFRDYGGFLSVSERSVSADKTVKIPMYPDVKTDIDFEGYPFPFDESKQKLFFSGGSLYKTIGKGGKYYEIVKRILTECPETVFWYAGEGDDSGLKKLKEFYPERAYHSFERKDLYSLLKKCTFYLSTYPICGNLMTQYAASAGVVPLTLKNGNDGSGTLIGQNELNFEFDDEETLIKEVKKLVYDENYRASRKTVFANSVVKEKDFDNALFNLIENDEKFFLMDNDFQSDEFKKLYLERINFSLVADCVAKKGRKNILDYPIYYFMGCVIKILNKFKKK